MTFLPEAESSARRAPAARGRAAVVIVGGGWAGLTAAAELARHGLEPTVLEAARQPGGRARMTPFDGLRLDNGQHILLGAYHDVLHILQTLGVAESSVFRRLPLELVLRDAAGTDVRLTAPSLPAPLNLLSGLLTATGLTFFERVSALRFVARARRDRFECAPDAPLADYLHACGQPPALTRALWQPLCLAALNVPVAQASTSIFLRVIRDAFFGARRDSDFLIPCADLGACLPRPAMDYIERRGGAVRLGARAQTLLIRGGAVAGVRLRNETLAATHVILAAAPQAAAQLLRDHAALAPVAAGLDGLGAQPICTAYLRYPEPVTLGREFVGVLDATVQWLFDHGKLSGRAGLIAAVVSGPGPHMRLATEALTDLIVAEVARLYPSWPGPLATKLIREKRATFSAAPGVDAHRPGPATPVKGLWLAGDYTATGYPSTLEGAVRSGLACARHILAQERKP